MATIALPEGSARLALERVLCTVDDSPAGADAVREALCVAAAAPQLSFVAVADSSGTIGSLDERRTQRALAQAQALAGSRGLVAATQLVGAHDVAGTLIDRAGPRGLLVAGSPAGLRQDGVVPALMHGATGPLLVARRGPDAGDIRPRILVAVDDSPAAGGVVALAGALAASCGGVVHLLHVAGRGYGTTSRHRLAELSTDLIALTGAEPVVDVLRGVHVAASVAQFARCSDTSLLVVGRGQTAQRGPSVVAEQVVDLATCSVLVVPAASAA